MPFQGGVIPFGLMYSTIAGAAGFPWWLTMLLTVVVFGGSSQLVFIDLLKSLGSPFQAVLGSNIVNARHLIYSAGVSEKFKDFPLRWKLLLAYLLTDQLYAIAEFNEVEKNSISKEREPWYYFGSGFCTWIFWVVSCGVGIAFGHFIPKSWNLGFSIPLMFMPLIFSVSKTKYAYWAAIFALPLVYLLKDLPFGFGIFLAIIFASTLAFVLQKKAEAK